MYYEETDTPAMARTSNLNEELGQVKYIFSDKTGTLTRNVMEFKKCTVGAEIYALADTPDDSLLIQVQQFNIYKLSFYCFKFQHIKEGHENADLLKELLVLLSVCHTVIPEKLPDGQYVYHAASPGEFFSF